MKEINMEALAVFVILLPGFVAARIVQSLADRSKQSELDKIVEALVYSFIVYALYSLCGFGLPVEWKSWKDAAGADHYLVNLHSKELLIIAGISVGLAFMLAASENHDLSGRLLRLLFITKNTARPTIWSDTFHEYKGFVQVELKDGRHVIGWVRRYSGDPEQASLFLSHAHWLDPNKGNVPIPGKGILLTKATGIKYVMCLDTPQRMDPITILSSDASKATAESTTGPTSKPVIETPQE